MKRLLITLWTTDLQSVEEADNPWHAAVVKHKKVETALGRRDNT